MKFKKQLLEILKEPNPVLRAANTDIESSWFGSEWLVTLAQNMIYTMRSVNGIGLAAPQIGINYNIAIAVVDKMPVVMINPVVLSKAEKTIEIEEGCLSCPGKEVRIPRPEWCEIRYNSINGKENIRLFGGMDSIIVLHECDHLLGVLITDYLERM